MRPVRCGPYGEKFVFELSAVVVLIVLNGVFALSELAVVSSRHPRLKALAASGKAGAASALALAGDPGRFLSAVQIGITLIGIVNGAYSGEAFGGRAAAVLESWGAPNKIAGPLGYGVVVVAITYLSVVVGELIPKNLAIRNPEGIACAVAPAMTMFATVAAPAVWLLDASTRAAFRLLRQPVESERRVTDEEIRTLIAEAESAGVIESGERRMITGVMRLADRAVIGLMTPRNIVDWIDVTASEADCRKRLLETTHSRLPVGEGSVDALIGVVLTRELLAVMLSGAAFDIREYVQRAPIVPDVTDALDVLELLRDADVPMALIHDEYGHFEGLVTPADILEAIAGVFKSDLGDDEYRAVERDDGSWLISGSMPVDELAETIGIALPTPRNYETVAGFLLSKFQHIPKAGESIESDGWRFEIVDLDGRRIDKVVAMRRLGPHRRAL
jgi:putative hemolysin